MPVDHIRYDLLTQKALRGVVRTVLTDVAKNGLPGDHHFFVTFDTRAEGVRLSQRMRTQYPEEMTIVLQHQFWDLSVSEDAFEVGLSFGGVAERLAIPFAAVNGFFDPSVQFGLQFKLADEADAETANPAPLPGPTKAEGEAAPPPAKSRRPPVAPVPAPANPASAPPAQETERPSDQSAHGGEVVSLDRFRKK
jgi:hypothetical protein